MGVTAVVLAGGAGTRMGAEQNKVYVRVADRPLLAWSIHTFERSHLVDDIVLVARHDDRRRVDAALSGEEVLKLRAVVAGGATRHDSEQAGLHAVEERIGMGDSDLIAIHDAARPFVPDDLLARLVEAARRVGGAVPGLAIERPIQRLGPDGTAQAVPTDALRRVQTPQIFRAPALLRAYRRAQRLGFRGVDTAETVARYSDLEIAVVPGDPRNIKVTFAQDLDVVEDLARDWSG